MKIKKVWVTIVVVTICTILSACGSSEGREVKGGEEQMEQSATAEQGNGSLENDAGSKFSKKTGLEMGNEATLGDWSITVTSIEFRSEVQDSIGFRTFTPDEGNQYAVVSVNVTNNGTSADSFLPSYGFHDDVSASIVYDENYQYSSSLLLAHRDDIHNTTLNPLTSKSGFIAFQLPNSVINSEESLKVIFSAGGDDVKWKLR